MVFKRFSMCCYCFSVRCNACLMLFGVFVCLYLCLFFLKIIDFCWAFYGPRLPTIALGAKNWLVGTKTKHKHEDVFAFFEFSNVSLFLLTRAFPCDFAELWKQTLYVDCFFAWFLGPLILLGIKTHTLGVRTFAGLLLFWSFLFYIMIFSCSGETWM